MSVHRVKRLDNICNEDMKITVTSVAKNLLNVNREVAYQASTEETPLPALKTRVRDPGVEPFLEMGKTNRGPKPIDNQQDT